MITIKSNGNILNMANDLPTYHRFSQENSARRIHLNFPQVPSNILCLLGKEPKTKTLPLFWNSSTWLINDLEKKESHQVVISKTKSSLLEVSDLLNCQKVCKYFTEIDFPSKTFRW